MTYSIVVINETPKIAPGETISLGIYLSGTGIPDKNRISIYYNPELIDREDGGEVSAFVRQATDSQSGDVLPVSGEEHEHSSDINIPGTHVSLVQPAFFEDPAITSDGNVISPRVTERGHDDHAPLEVNINTDSCSPGEYTIPIILTYVMDGEIYQERENAKVQIQGWAERNRQWIEAVAALGVIATIGILLAQLM